MLISLCLPKWLPHFAFLLTVNVSSCCSASTTLGVDFGRSCRWVVISHCFNLQFPSDI